MVCEVDVIKNTIAELRKKHNMTQKEAADKLSVSRQTIISLESGKYNPSITLAHKIAVMFEKKIEDIFIFEEEEI